MRHIVDQKSRRPACVMVDTGIMHGADTVAAMALGASFTMIGRAYLYGLMAGGREGMDRTIEILTVEIVRTMCLLGVSLISELEPRHVTQLHRPLPRGGMRITRPHCQGRLQQRVQQRGPHDGVHRQTATDAAKC